MLVEENICSFLQFMTWLSGDLWKQVTARIHRCHLPSCFSLGTPGKIQVCGELRSNWRSPHHLYHLLLLCHSGFDLGLHAPLSRVQASFGFVRHIISFFMSGLLFNNSSKISAVKSSLLFIKALILGLANVRINIKNCTCKFMLYHWYSEFNKVFILYT